MSKVTTDEIKAALEELFTKGDWEMDVSEDVSREFDKRMKVFTNITTKLHERLTELEGIVDTLKIDAITADVPATTGRLASIEAAATKGKTATLKVRMGSGSKDAERRAERRVA